MATAKIIPFPVRGDCCPNAPAIAAQDQAIEDLRETVKGHAEAAGRVEEKLDKILYTLISMLLAGLLATGGWLFLLLKTILDSKK